MPTVRKIGRSGAGGKVVAPHPDEAVGVLSPGNHGQVDKALPGLRTRKGSSDTKSSPQETTTYGPSNLAAAVFKTLQKERRNSLAPKEDNSEESTPKLVEVSEKNLPEVPQKKMVTSCGRSVSRGKDSGPPPIFSNKVPSMSRDDKEPSKSRDEKNSNPRRSVSAGRHREPFDNSSKIGPNLGSYKGVAKAFLKTTSKVESLPARKPEAKVSAKQEQQVFPKTEVPKDNATGYSSQLENRILMLEEKVSQLTDELRDAKEELHTRNKKVLEDILLRISNIEKAVTSSGEQQQQRRTSLSSLENADLEARKSSSGHKSLEERILPHLMLLKNRPNLQQKLVESRTALQIKLSEERMLLSAKIAALEGSEVRSTEGEVIAAEFLASLNHPEYPSIYPATAELENVRPEYVPVKGSPMIIERPSSTGKNTSERKRKSTEPDGGFSCGESNVAAPSEDFFPSLECDETIIQVSTDDQENTVPATGIQDFEGAAESEETLCPLGNKVAMAGWYVYDGEGIVLAHDDGNCSFYDVANMEEKTQYKSPEGIAPATWRDCWLVRAAGPDGSANKYIVAASAGTASDPAFCSWNFYEKTIAAYHSEAPSWPVTPTISGKSSTDTSKVSTGSSSSTTETSIICKALGSPASSSDMPLWWYKPCGPVIASGGSGLKSLSLYDIRDGDLIMKWDINRRMASMDFTCPIQWRNKDTLLVAEDDGISVWDIGNLHPQPLHNIHFADKDIRALHIYNSDGEINGGVRQRISSKDCGDIDGVFATGEAVHALDFRVPSGIALKIPTFGQKVHSLYAHGDAVYAGVTAMGKSMVQHWSIKMANPMLLYSLPGSASTCHESQLQISQVWGSPDSVMAINGNGLFVFDPTSELQTVIGGDDLYCPSFDYTSSKVLLVSKDRPAGWQYWP